MQLLNKTDRRILHLAVPAFGALIAEPLYVLTDTAIVGHIGTDELAGLAIAASILVTGFAMMIFLAYGTTGMVARARGAGDASGGIQIGLQGVWLAAGCGLVLAGLGALFAEPLVGVFGASAEVTEFALTYFRISLIGFPGLLISTAAIGFLRGIQDTRTPLILAATTVIANAVIEVVFVFGFDWGIAGSAWSTVIVQLVAAAWMIRLLIAASVKEQIPLGPDRVLLLRYLHVGAYLFVRTSMMRVAFLLSVLLAARLSTPELAAHQIGLEVYTAIALALDAVAIAGQALVGETLGARDPDGARRLVRRMMMWGIATGSIAMLVLLAVHAIVPGVFSADPEVQESVRSLLFIFAFAQPIAGLVFALDGVLIGAGDLRYLALASVATVLPFVVLALSVPATLVWLWAALVAYLAFRAISLVGRVWGDRWITLGQ
jgi:MATE family, multidrug efflux pump